MDKHVSGVRIFDKHPNAPDFVICSLVLTPDDIAEWVSNNPDFVSEYKGKTQVRLQIKRSKDGKVYAEIDSYKKSEKTFTEPKDDLPF